MTTTAINFNTTPGIISPQPPVVWTRAAWSGTWVLRTDLKVLEAQWTLAPESSTATLYKEFGQVLLSGANALTTVTKETTRGYFVLIKYPSDDESAAKYWLGYAESPITVDFHPARDSLPEAGKQTIPCFGFLEALKFAIIASTVHLDPTDATKLKRSFGGVVFNDGEKGNRHSAKLTITESGETSPSAYAFALPDEKDPDWWSTRDIAEHLVAFHLPTPSGLASDAGIPFSISNLTQLPNWDRPTIATDGRSVADILIELFSAERLMQFGIGAVAGAGTPPAITSVNIQPDTTIPGALALVGVGDMPANLDQYTFAGETDPMTDITVTEDDSDVVDQVIVQGPPEIGIATLTFGESGELENDWSTTDETDYETGSSLAVGWADKFQFERRELNDQVRDKPQLKKVYRTLRIKKAWAGTAKPGSTAKPVFVPPPVTDPVTPPYVPYLGNCRILDRLPLFADVDYKGAVADVDEAEGQTPIVSIVTITDPESTLPVELSRIRKLKAGVQPRNADAIEFGVTPLADNEFGPKIQLVVDGGPNHAIAATAFSGNTADVNQARAFGGYDYKTIRATVAIQGDRRPLWKLPVDADVASLDVVRRKIIDLDIPGAEVIHIAADTVVGFDAAGAEETSAGGILRDPSNLLKSIATLYAEHHLVSRKRVVITTGRRPINISVGGIITTVSGYGTVNSVIRSIRLATPLDQAGSARPEMTITAATVTFDPMQLLTGEDTGEVFNDSPEARRDRQRTKMLHRRWALRTRRIERNPGRFGMDE